MPTLASELRNKLERTIAGTKSDPSSGARAAAEAGARAALESLAVHHHEPYPHMKPAQCELRNHLRARARQLGDRQDRSGRLGIDHLVGECAYEHWHRMLFARFLAENGLLIEPEENMAISLAEAEELAKEDDLDVWVFASRCAQRMLPQIFQPDDPLLRVSFATEHMLKLERLLASLPAAVFTASDALGWVYQFWQSRKKDKVNRSEVKIGADEISAVTQLFTEPYMVEFLIHNTLGAWWAGKRLTAEDAENVATEEELRRKLALPGVGWGYLRFVRGEDGEGGPWRPAASTFDGWPKTAAELRVLDPCCGSGHFLVAALHHLVPIRVAEEGLSAADAVDSVLRDNLHGLEIDERCCQIAAFALAFAAWTYPKAGGYRPLPHLHIACTGIGPQSTQEQWVKLAGESGIPMPTVGREVIKNGLLNLHRLFSQAPTLGSLINPAELPADLIAADYETIQPYLTVIRAVEKADDETHERAVAAAGMVRAAELLARSYSLVVTNVPFLSAKRQHEALRRHLVEHFGDAKADLATALLSRIADLLSAGGTWGVVTPHEWLFLPSYTTFRISTLQHMSICLGARLGYRAFQTPLRAAPVLMIVANLRPSDTSTVSFVDLSDHGNSVEKSHCLPSWTIQTVAQDTQLENPDSRLLTVVDHTSVLIGDAAPCATGMLTSDNQQFYFQSWEVCEFGTVWEPLQCAPSTSGDYTGRTSIVRWERGKGALYRLAESVKHLNHAAQNWRRGQEMWDRYGVAIKGMGDLAATLYTGQHFENNTLVTVPEDRGMLAAIWCFFSSPKFRDVVRTIDKSLKLTNSSVERVPFDLAHWQKVAVEKYPNGLPEPESDDPTQWLFHGRPDEAQEGKKLQVAVARLLGYRWPAELDGKMRLSKRVRALIAKCGELAKFADNDGIVCIPAVRGEDPAAERLHRLLAACDIEPEGDLDDWLRNDFFEEHCGLFHHRPFIWHIWDGRKRDGFHALVNCHKLCEDDGKGRRLLESLTYAYLGEWITRQKDGAKRREGGAEDRLAAAVELQNRLEAILAGEPPFDLFVRWKPLAEQPIRWEPDINDGVRMNIRPFMALDLPVGGRKGAGILRYKPKIKWTKDRGKEPDRPKEDYPWFWSFDPDNADHAVDFLGGDKFDGNRWNDCHYTNAAKQAAREATEDD